MDKFYKLYTEVTRYKKEFNKDKTALEEQRKGILKEKGIVNKVKAYNAYKNKDYELGKKYGTRVVDKYNCKVPSVDATSDPLDYGRYTSELISKYKENEKDNNSDTLKNKLQRGWINRMVSSGKKGSDELKAGLIKKIEDRDKLIEKSSGTHKVQSELKDKIKNLEKTNSLRHQNN